VRGNRIAAAATILESARTTLLHTDAESIFYTLLSDSSCNLGKLGVKRQNSGAGPNLLRGESCRG